MTIDQEVELLKKIVRELAKLLNQEAELRGQYPDGLRHVGYPMLCGLLAQFDSDEEDAKR